MSDVKRLRLLHLDAGETLAIPAGEAVEVPPGVEVRCEAPEPGVYVSLCRPAFGPPRLRREHEA